MHQEVIYFTTSFFIILFVCKKLSNISMVINQDIENHNREYERKIHIINDKINKINLEILQIDHSIMIDKEKFYQKYNQAFEYKVNINNKYEPNDITKIVGEILN